MRLNLGCGLSAPDGWVNIDSSFRVWLDKIPLLPALTGYKRRFSPNILRIDLRRPLPFPTDSVELIYCSHFIEHITLTDAKNLLKECYRVLMPEGRIRLVTPDLHSQVRWYQDRRQNPELRAGAADYFLKNLEVFFDRSEDPGLVRHFLQKWQNKNLHKWLYDEFSMQQLLEKQGFHQIKVEVGKESDFPDLAILETSQRRKNSLCAEARA